MTRKNIVHWLTHESFYNVVERYRKDFERRNNVRLSTIKATEMMAKNYSIPKVKFNLGGQIERKKRRRN